MAMYVDKNKLYIFVADSDVIDNNKIAGSTNKDRVVGGYYTPGDSNQNKLFYDFIEIKNVDEVSNRSIFLSANKLKNYKEEISNKIKKKFSNIYKGKMEEFDQACDYLIKKGDFQICSYLYLTGDRPYLQFELTDEWKEFLKVVYSQTTTIVVEKLKDKYVVYPLFHPLFASNEEILKLYNIKINKEEINNDQALETNVFLDNFKYFLEKNYGHLKDNSVDKYMNVIKSIKDIIPGLEETSKFYEYKLNEFPEVIKRIENSSEYKDANTRRNNDVSATLNKFKIYISKLINDDASNKIYYGVPGCGKSYYIENELLKDVDKDNNVFRTTFYLDYSNSDFIGQLMPVTEDGNVKYKNIPGPFTLALERALSTNDMVYLVIEEINRGNAAAIFGDVFQLLDRRDKCEGRYFFGDSQYPITNEFIDSYLNSKNEEGFFNRHNKGDKIYIPHNLAIYATMNTSDQNVFPLDSAFQRRWKREMIVGDWDSVDKWDNKYIPYFGITWRQFAETMNKAITDGNKNGEFISEDKMFGPYFISQDYLVNKDIVDNDYIDPVCTEKYKGFVNNVIDYLYNDVTKFNHELIFDEKMNTYHEVYTKMIDNEDYRRILEENNKNVQFMELMNNVFTPEVLSKLKGNNEQ